MSIPKITVGIRYHDPKNFRYLESCLYSLMAQENVTVSTVIATQGFTKDETYQLAKSIDEIWLGNHSPPFVTNVSNNQKKDLRCELLNRIVKVHYNYIKNDFLYFLDYDDYIYSHALSTLTKNIVGTDYALAYALIMAQDNYKVGGYYFCRNIVDYFGIQDKNKLDLIKENFLPLHSYIYHTKIIEISDIYFDEDVLRGEDYLTLLRVASKYRMHKGEKNNLIGVYNFYSDELNSTPNIFENKPYNADCEKYKLWKKSQEKINQYKEKILINLYASDV